MNTDSIQPQRTQRGVAAFRNTILQLRARTTKIWSAVAERSGDTAFRAAGCFQKRRGASLPAAVQKIVVAAKGRVRFIGVHWLAIHRSSRFQSVLQMPI
jgi:hypothetical protein